MAREFKDYLDFNTTTKVKKIIYSLAEHAADRDVPLVAMKYILRAKSETEGYATMDRPTIRLVWAHLSNFVNHRREYRKYYDCIRELITYEVNYNETQVLNVSRSIIGTHYATRGKP